MGDAKQLYRDAPDPDGYQAAAGRPVSRKAEPYAPVRLGEARKRNRVLLFTIEGNAGQGDTYEGYIPDPIPAKHYAQMLQDVVDFGPTIAQATMLTNILGAENMRRLAECDALEPDDLLKIMEQVGQRALGPYEAMGAALKNA